MNANDVPADLAGRIERLADRLTADGDLRDKRWRAALHAVPRHLFVPDVALANSNESPGVKYPVNRGEDPETWWNAVYSDTVLITQLDDGAGELTTGAGLATSSNSAPRPVISLLEQLRLRDHDQVLEIGTGTGWTSALLCHRLGEEYVTSIEVDRQVAEDGRKNLHTAGYHPRLIVGDGARGGADGAPYDRVHVTCAVERVPYAWVEHTRPGGVIVTPYTSGYAYGHLARLVVLGDGTAVGRFPGSAGFMMLRSQRHVKGPPSSFLHHEDESERSHTGLDPRTVAWDSVAADLAVGAQVPGCQSRMCQADDDSGEWTFWLFETTTYTGSWATVAYVPGHPRFEVEQYGARRLWDEVEAAYLRWTRAGRPGRERFGMTVTPHEEHIWFDEPEHVISAADLPSSRWRR